MERIFIIRNFTKKQILFKYFLIITGILMSFSLNGQSFFEKAKNTVKKVENSVDRFLNNEEQRSNIKTENNNISNDSMLFESNEINNVDSVFVLKVSDIKSIQADSEDVLTSLKVYNLNGNVKSIKYNSGEFKEFNEDGNLIRFGEKDKYEIKREYVSKFRYIQNKSAYDVSFPERNTRKERWDSGTYEDLWESFVFDENCRIKEYTNRLNYSGQTSKEYIYKNDEDRLPSTMIETSFWAEGIVKITYTYEYIVIDNAGNWTKRKSEIIIEKTEFNYISNELEVNKESIILIENAIIEYFNY